MTAVGIEVAKHEHLEDAFKRALRRNPSKIVFLGSAPEHARRALQSGHAVEVLPDYVKPGTDIDWIEPLPVRKDEGLGVAEPSVEAETKYDPKQSEATSDDTVERLECIANERLRSLYICSGVCGIWFIATILAGNLMAGMGLAKLFCVVGTWVMLALSGGVLWEESQKTLGALRRLRHADRLTTAAEE